MCRILEQFSYYRIRKICVGFLVCQNNIWMEVINSDVFLVKFLVESRTVVATNVLCLKTSVQVTVCFLDIFLYRTFGKKTSNTYYRFF
jgi:hypothetical protein